MLGGITPVIEEKRKDSLVDFIALASEEVAIRSVFPHEIDTWDPYEGEVRVWKAEARA